MAHSHISIEPEYELLLDAIVPLELPRIDHAAWDPGRWGNLLNIADWHRLSPALFTHLRSTESVPAPVMSALERAYLANAARSLFVRETLAGAHRALGREGIEPLLLKGSGLIETVYADPAEREMLDIDLLVTEQDLDRATAVLMELGYRPRFDPDAIVVPERPASNPAPPHHGRPLVGPDALVAFELHRHITIEGEGKGFGLDGIWERARIMPRTGHRVPSPEDLLIHVAFHFTRNRLGGSAARRNTGGALAQIRDMRQLVVGENLDWPRLSRIAGDFGLGTRVFLGLFAARELGVPVPDDALRALRPVGFDDEIGRRLVTLRVLRSGDHLPVRSMRWMFAPSREALRRGWNADPNATLSLARAYMRRAKAHVPEGRSALRRPWLYLQDRRLNGHIEALGERV